MQIDRSSFLLFTVALAAGGAGGWVLRDRDVVGSLLAPDRGEQAMTSRLTDLTDAQRANLPPAPVCDDTTASVSPCPPIGPAAEGGCLNMAARRCADFKVSFKPNVAENAIACILQLKGAELCDPLRANLCGHTALMAACQDTAPAADADAEPSAPVPPTKVALACESIVKGCAGTPLAPTMSDCRMTLSGMNANGRDGMVACMATHCGDRGLIGCEASATALPPAPMTRL